MSLLSNQQTETTDDKTTSFVCENFDDESTLYLVLKYCVHINFFLSFSHKWSSIRLHNIDNTSNPHISALYLDVDAI